RYLYLPRLRDEDVLHAAIQEGVASLAWQTDTFAYAESWDEQRQRYQGLRAAQSIRVIVDDRSLLVKPEAAAAQFAQDRDAEAASAAATGATSGTTGSPTTGTVVSPPTQPGRTGGIAPPPKLGRFHGSASVDPLRLGRDAARIAEEVVQHLAGIVGAKLDITIEIHAELPDGASDKLV